MASAQVDAEEDRLRIAAALGNDKKALRELVRAGRASPGGTSAEKAKQRPVVEVIHLLKLVGAVLGVWSSIHCRGPWSHTVAEFSCHLQDLSTL